MLLSFAQFEREIGAERIRDKVAASKKKGIWIGGCVPYGYEPKGQLVAPSKYAAVMADKRAKIHHIITSFVLMEV